MFCSRFSETSAVALRDDEVVGFLVAFRCPLTNAFFLWQVATKPRHGIPNLGFEMIHWATQKEIEKGCTTIEASVDVKNTAIVHLMRSLNKALNGHLTKQIYFRSNLLTADNGTPHHDETLLKIDLGGGNK